MVYFLRWTHLYIYTTIKLTLISSEIILYIVLKSHLRGGFPKKNDVSDLEIYNERVEDGSYINTDCSSKINAFYFNGMFYTPM